MAYKLTKTPDPENKFDLTTVSFEFDGEITSGQFLEILEDFMRACGWHVASLQMEEVADEAAS